MHNVFLESHNIKNPYFGFGQFNYHLIKGFFKANIKDIKFTLHAKNTSILKEEFGTYFDYKTYKSWSRHPLFRIKKKYQIWHSLNQNIKIEPYHKIPYLLTVHDVNFMEETSGSIKQETQKRFYEKLNRSHAITYISKFAKAATHQHFKVPNVPEYVIYNGNPIKDIVLSQNFRPEYVPKRPFLFFIGEITARKNVHTLIEMLPFLPDYDLILAGNNNTKYCQEKLNKTLLKTQMKSRVFFSGKINDLEKQYYFKNCSAFVFPSLREGFGIPPIEAMRFGKPVFLSNTTSLPEIGGEHAFYWTHFDPKYMASIFEFGMHTFETHKKEYEQQYIQRAHFFNWDTAALQYLKTYRSLI